MDPLSPDAQATLLLTAQLGKASDDSRPLTPTEWGRFALWLRDKGLRPGSLLTDASRELLEAWHDETLPRARLAGLLGRGTALALAVEKWQRAGLWVLTRSDPDYPKRIKERLGAHSPAVFFGCGDRTLLSVAAVAVVGSRKASPEDLTYATILGADLARAGYALVSGGARGIDETAMAGALDASGTAVGVLADSLLKAAVAHQWRASLRRGDLVLVSPFHPEAGFSVGNAMARNKYVYCLAVAAVVVHSGRSGGTWNGALENLERGWVPLWVKPTHRPRGRQRRTDPEGRALAAGATVGDGCSGGRAERGAATRDTPGSGWGRGRLIARGGCCRAGPPRGGAGARGRAVLAAAMGVGDGAGPRRAVPVRGLLPEARAGPRGRSAEAGRARGTHGADGCPARSLVAAGDGGRPGHEENETRVLRARSA